MKSVKQRFNRKYIPLQYKLLGYFLLFGAIILIVLWVFQSFCLKPLFTMSKSAQVKSGASKISVAIEQNKNIWTTIDNVASYNSLSVDIYESNAGLLFPKYQCSYDNPATRLYLDEHQVYELYSKAKSNNGTYMTVNTNSVSDIARAKLEKLQRALVATEDSVGGSVRFSADYSAENENMIYADIITQSDGSEKFMVITSSITPLSNTIEIIRGQMLLVSIAFILLAVVFSIIVSRHIASPISKTNRAAKKLAEKDYDVNFNAVGYLEVEELNETLNYAKTELAATEKLQQELIANISHDLRTPLTMIKGYAEVMRDIPDENTPENVQVIIDEASRLSTLVSDLLDLSKLQSGALQAEKLDFSLTQSVRDILCRYSKLIEQEGYVITFDCAEEVYINADELRMSQVIYNLVNNAVNHAGADKTVIIRQLVSGDRVRFEVVDHGEGIPADKLPYIWERYYKVDKEHRRGVIGSGLGLSIVKSILDAHGARYGVKSALGKGSTFWFELPVVLKPDSDGENDAAETE